MRLIDADALFEVIEKSMAENPHKEKTQMAMHIHEHKYFLTLLTGSPTIQPEPKWIPCSERLPTTSSEKIVTFQSGYVGTASFILREKIYCGRMLVSTRENFWQVLEEDEEEGEVVAWMPLPEPYKGGDAE